MGQFKFALWLYYWYLQTSHFEFEWDNGNSEKSSKKHGVSQEEVEAAFALKLGAPIGRQTSPSVEEERLCLIGPSLTNRMISVVFTLRDGRVRPISCRPANKKEKLAYEAISKTIKRIR